jgi:hypothetical protein
MERDASAKTVAEAIRQLTIAHHPAQTMLNPRDIPARAARLAAMP